MCEVSTRGHWITHAWLAETWVGVDVQEVPKACALSLKVRIKGVPDEDGNFHIGLRIATDERLSTKVKVTKN
ncbi:unnamed protein product [Strongylus vulgaris]|uniref:Uncharacterized protein n=1 Tax=Strongylus vulgaris TaxID=40348 RepID=A0A3P7LNS6_STRVU|nr:unnamed protein product [Strongylus vulgaris]